MKLRLPFAAGVACAATLALAGNAQAVELSARSTSRVSHVDYVVDGDTVRLTSGRYVRLIGYDTPEVGRRYYRAATRSLNRFVPASGRVRLVNPRSVDNADHYGRMLRYVRVAGSDAGKRLLRQGYGHARYDSRDGYDWHPLERRYHRIDNHTRNLW